jgi:hypothetical protein
MERLNSLSIKSDTIVDRAGRIVAVLCKELPEDLLFAYANVFVTSEDLLAYMENILTPILDGFDAFKHDKNLYGYRGYSGASTQRGFPDWLMRGISAVAKANGEDTQHNRMMTKTTLRNLSVDGNVLKDDKGQIIATISKELSDQAIKSYAHHFAAAVDLLDIIDFTSGEELAEIEQAFKTGREFSKHENLPADVPVLGEPNSVIPDKLRATRQLVARARGKEYKDWE